MSTTMSTTLQLHAVMEKPKRPCSVYNLFYQIEREHILQSLPNPNESDGGSTSVREKHILEEIELDNKRGKATEVSSDQDLRPHRYKHLTLPNDWFKSGKRVRKHRKTKWDNGGLGFNELNSMIKERWDNVDDETRAYLKSISDGEWDKYRDVLKVWKKKRDELEKELTRRRTAVQKLKSDENDQDDSEAEDESEEMEEDEKPTRGADIEEKEMVEAEDAKKEESKIIVPAIPPMRRNSNQSRDSDQLDVGGSAKMVSSRTTNGTGGTQHMYNPVSSRKSTDPDLKSDPKSQHPHTVPVDNSAVEKMMAHQRAILASSLEEQRQMEERHTIPNEAFPLPDQRRVTPNEGRMFLNEPSPFPGSRDFLPRRPVNQLLSVTPSSVGREVPSRFHYNGCDAIDRQIRAMEMEKLDMERRNMNRYDSGFSNSAMLYGKVQLLDRRIEAKEREIEEMLMQRTLHTRQDINSTMLHGNHSSFVRRASDFELGRRGEYSFGVNRGVMETLPERLPPRDHDQVEHGDPRQHRRMSMPMMPMSRRGLYGNHRDEPEGTNEPRALETMVSVEEHDSTPKTFCGFTPSSNKFSLQVGRENPPIPFERATLPSDDLDKSPVPKSPGVLYSPTSFGSVKVTVNSGNVPMKKRHNALANTSPPSKTPDRRFSGSPTNPNLGYFSASLKDTPKLEKGPDFEKEELLIHSLMSIKDTRPQDETSPQPVPDLPFQGRGDDDPSLDPRRPAAAATVNNNCGSVRDALVSFSSYFQPTPENLREKMNRPGVYMPRV